MAAVHYKENGLNVQYVAKFFEKEQADDYFAQLKKLPFYKPSLKLRRKRIKRQMFGFGDPHLTYAFCGSEVAIQPWTPLLLDIRHRVEKYAGCSFNFVLLNLYPDGFSFVSQHKDNKPTLDVTFPIVTVSLGEKRTLEFKRRKFNSICIELEHGSLYSMEKPTNELFTHGISPEPSAKNMRISLSFRHLIPEVGPQFPPSNQSSSVKPSIKKKDDSNQKPSVKVDSKKEFDSNPEPSDSLLDDLNEDMYYWTLNWETYVQVLMKKNYSIKIHIRNFKELANGDLAATKIGIMMSPATWSDFSKKLSNFRFESFCDSFIANNQLLMACLNEDNCFLQQIFQTSSSDGFFFKPGGIKLWKDQFLKLQESSRDITNAIIEALLVRVLPNLILNSSPVCRQHHANMETAKLNFLSCLTQEIKHWMNKIFECNGCFYQFPEPRDHRCYLYSEQEKFNIDKKTILLNLNINKIVQSLFETCSCYFTKEFLKQLDMSFFESFFEKIFCNKVC